MRGAGQGEGTGRRHSWRSDGTSALGIVSVHHGDNCEVEFTSVTTASGTGSMTGRLYFSPDSEFSLMTGYGHYVETYEKVDDSWKLKTTQITRIRVEAV
jgi:hypothetical protein